MNFLKLVISAIGLSAVGAKQFCKPTGQWRLSSGQIVDTPIRFEVDYMIEMFGLCDASFVLDEIDWKAESGQRFMFPNPCPARSPICPTPDGMAWCTFWYITYKDIDENQFYPMQEFTPGYAVINPTDPDGDGTGYYPDDPNHPINYYLPNWGYGDRAFFESQDDRPAAEEYITQILGVIGREMRKFVVAFDEDSFDLELIAQQGSSNDKELEIHLQLGDTPSNEPLDGHFWYYGPEETGGNALKTTFVLETIIVHLFDDTTDTFDIKPESQLGRMGFLPVYFLMYPPNSLDVFCMDAPANFQIVQDRQ